MINLDPQSLAFWSYYLEQLPALSRPASPRVEAAPAGSFEITDGLIALYLEGKKSAGSSIKEDFISAGDPLPQAGNYWIVLDGEARPALLLRTRRVEENRFGEIPAHVAQAEGEGDGSVAYWKEVHAALYQPHLAAWGVDDLDEATVITEHFELLASRCSLHERAPHLLSI